jgi:glycosyltransferase involved in cell wall biosynthesis
MNRLLLATDVWHPEVNEISRLLQSTVDVLKPFLQTKVVQPGDFTTGLKAALGIRGGIRKSIEEFKPDFIHIATEGIVGLAVREYCLVNHLKFTTSYHTDLPEVANSKWWIPKWIGYAYVRWFHSPSQTVMVHSRKARRILKKRGFQNKFTTWSKGADTKLFHPRERKLKLTRPVLLHINNQDGLRDFLAYRDTICTKIIVGDGPKIEAIKANYPPSLWLKYYKSLQGEELAQLYNEADVFVSTRKINHGLESIEALASGVPVASWYIDNDILPDMSSVVSMDYSLRRAIKNALSFGLKKDCVKFAKNYCNLKRCAMQFLHNLKKAK